MCYFAGGGSDALLRRGSQCNWASGLCLLGTRRCAAMQLGPRDSVSGSASPRIGVENGNLLNMDRRGAGGGISQGLLPELPEPRTPAWSTRLSVGSLGPTPLGGQWLCGPFAASSSKNERAERAPALPPELARSLLTGAKHGLSVGRGPWVPVAPGTHSPKGKSLDGPHPPSATPHHTPSCCCLVSPVSQLAIGSVLCGRRAPASSAKNERPSLSFHRSWRSLCCCFQACSMARPCPW
jgi:hypothetical protein